MCICVYERQRVSWKSERGIKGEEPALIEKRELVGW